MLFRRRRESLHQRLAREGGVRLEGVDPNGSWLEAGITGLARPREWDAVVSVYAPGLAGEAATFVVLPDGALLIEEGPDDLAQFADALEGSLAPPYRAEATRRESETWAVGARRIEVLELEEDVGGEELSLTVHDGRRDVLVDGARSPASLLELQRWAEERYTSYSVTAQHLDGSLWEVRLTAL